MQKKFNPRYQEVAQVVDFLSPVMYYKYNPTLENWKKVSEYSLTAARAYHTKKPIIPYIS